MKTAWDYEYSGRRVRESSRRDRKWNFESEIESLICLISEDERTMKWKHHEDRTTGGYMAKDSGVRKSTKWRLRWRTKTRLKEDLL